jgi:MFS family permease
MFPCAAAVIGLGGLRALRLPRAGAIARRAHRGEWRQLLRSPAYLRLLAFAFLCYLSLQGPLFLFPILIRGQGGGIEAISRMWALMLLVEVPMVALFGAIASRLGVRGVIGMGMAAAALRWSISGWVDDLRWITAAQLLHGVTVCGVMLGLPVYIDSIVPERLRSTAQGLMTMLGLSCASIASNLVGGWLIERLGPAAPARVGGLLAFGVMLTVPLLLQRPGSAVRG